MADVLHDVEWVDSGDYGEGGEEENLEKLLQFAVMVSRIKASGHLTQEKARELRDKFLDRMRIDELDSKSDDEADCL